MHHLLRVVIEFGFGATMIAGASFPAFINEAVKSEDSTGYVERCEMVVWKALLEENIKGLYFRRLRNKKYEHS